MRKTKVLSLLLSLVLAYALAIPAAAVNSGSGSISDSWQPLHNTGADVDVPLHLTGTDGEVDTVNALHFTYVADYEETTCDGEAIALYTVYPEARLWRTTTSDYCTVDGYLATMENGGLHKGERVEHYELEEPQDAWYWYPYTTDVGKYFILEFNDSNFTVKLAVHVVEGTNPPSTPVIFSWGYVGVSQHCTDNFSQMKEVLGDSLAWTLPVGAVVTLPRTTSTVTCFPASIVSTLEQESEWDEYWGPGVTDVETYLCNDRQCFSVEPGMVYQITYDYFAKLDDNYGYEYGNYSWDVTPFGPPSMDLIAADDSVPAVSDAPVGTNVPSAPEGQVTAEGIRVLMENTEFITDVGHWTEFSFTNTTDQPIQGCYGLVSYYPRKSKFVFSDGSAQIYYSAQFTPFDLDLAPGETKTFKQNSFFPMRLDVQMEWIKFDDQAEKDQFIAAAPLALKDRLGDKYENYAIFDKDEGEAFLKDNFGITFLPPAD